MQEIMSQVNLDDCDRSSTTLRLCVQIPLEASDGFQVAAGTCPSRLRLISLACRDRALDGRLDRVKEQVALVHQSVARLAQLAA